jgi:hypothetical protein
VLYQPDSCFFFVYSVSIFDYCYIMIHN